MDEYIEEIVKEMMQIGKKRLSKEKPLIAKGEMDVLFYLKSNSSKSLTPSDLSEYLGLSRSSITVFLNELEGKGLIKRIIDGTDRRRMQIVISKTGESILKKNFDNFYGYIKDALISIGEDDAKELLRIIRKLNER